MLPDSWRKPPSTELLAVASLLLLLAAPAVGQSGRRAKPPGAASPPTVNDSAETSTQPETRQIARPITLIAAKQPTSKRLLSEDSIFSSFVHRLSEVANVTTTSAGDLKREAAVARAKKEADAFVVLLEFDIDSFQNGTIILNSPDLNVKVLALNPHTGQEKFKGKVYYKAVGGGVMKRDNWPNGTPIKITTEAVGIEAAEQILDWLVLESRKEKN